ncbi:MAG: hypothetical protein GF383_06665 [Candidatus Lokiarchaeota archaeon]|nr:hypothetical protein [Candidatus Lokiarchaeota archaeon]MBD3339799.1 hypothetical protein [Candidatus Lokiarchaeota archaeon]
MADPTIYKEFSEFGKKIKPVYTLLILSAIIIFFFGIVALFINVVVLIILLLSQKKIKKIASNLKSKTLSSYRIKFLIGFSIGFIGRFGSQLSLFFIMIFLIFYNNYGGRFSWLYYSYITRTFIWGGLVFHIQILFIVFLIAYLLMTTGAFIELSAWNDFWIFFKKNKLLIPNEIYEKCITGIKNNRLADIFNIFGILIFTLFIAYIYNIKGFHKLSSLEKMADIQHRSNKTETNKGDEEKLDYCPNCKSAITTEESFCVKCGTKIR